jgi:hypothetical protein
LTGKIWKVCQELEFRMRLREDIGKSAPPQSNYRVGKSDKNYYFNTLEIN